MAKHIFVTGGVVSSLGKGLTSASIGMLLEHRGLRVRLQKFDPYINVDPGTMSPYQHGEVYVLDDGSETDLDLGHYERITGIEMSARNIWTSGRLYSEVFEAEENGHYMGQTVQIMPHLTNKIIEKLTMLGEQADIVVAEIGGTVGDIESLAFLEAIRQLYTDLGPRRAMFIHLTLVPYIVHAGEMKTKPTQHSVKEMREIGIQPDILICRTKTPLSKSTKEKIALFSNVAVEAVISAIDVGCIYELPEHLHAEGLDDLIAERLNIWSRQPDMSAWHRIVERFKKPSKGSVKIGVVGKYVHLKDAYKSLHESLVHGGLANDCKGELEYIDSEQVEKEGTDKMLAHLDAVLVPGGFGDRGTEGKIDAIRYARENKIPFFGICLGMQMAVVEYARHVAGLEAANSTEFDPDTPHPVIALITEWLDREGRVEKREAGADLGGTMRLGGQSCALAADSLARKVYGADTIVERHRHRYEVNNIYLNRLQQAGLKVSGKSEDGRLCEMVELPGHPWFIGCQFHPEFTSTPRAGHPLFTAFVRAALAHQESGKDSPVTPIRQAAS